jgi:hypothetical protein
MNTFTVLTHTHIPFMCNAPKGKTCMPTTEEGVYFFAYTDSAYVQAHLRQTECCWGMYTHTHKEKPMLFHNPGLPKGTEIRFASGELAVLTMDAVYTNDMDLHQDTLIDVWYTIRHRRMLDQHATFTTDEIESMLPCPTCFGLDSVCDGSGDNCSPF